MNTIHLVASRVLTEVGSADSAKSFFDSGIGLMIQNAFIVVGILIVIATLFQAIKNFASGKIGPAAKTIIIGVIGAVICFDLSLPFSLVTGVTKLFEALISTINGFFS